MMKRVLLVNDNWDLLDIVAEALLMKSYQVIICNKSEKALEKIEKHNPELIISKIEMNGIHGKNLVAHLTTHQEKIPIIFLASRYLSKYQKQFKDMENVKVLPEKKGNVKLLLEEVERILPQGIFSESFLSGDYRSALGKPLGNAILKEILGIGGTGIVYLGVHQVLDIPVAVKVLSPSVYNEPETILRFLREAKVLASIQHPNIIQILDANKQEGIYFLIMRYIHGRSLMDILKQEGKFPYNKAGNIILKVARGLAAAHKQMILHRDVKPSNILISNDGEIVKIIDFGLARRVKKEEEITKDGVVLGTPGYISPEQCLNQSLDETSDIYSLGATFYRAITGKEPFGGSSLTKLFAQLKGNFVLPHVLEPSIPMKISEIISKMLAKNKHERYQNMENVIEDLENVL
ncbi:MAG: protein kinase [Candidatus Brocadiae bacterium]|nr:protein kinase [Candidatus Brocadiia bacterium]